MKSLAIRSFTLTLLVIAAALWLTAEPEASAIVDEHVRLKSLD